MEEIEAILDAAQELHMSEEKHKRKKIERMNMEELQPMMCAKSGGDYAVCMKCAGFKTCRPGQRAVVLRMQEKAHTAPQEPAAEPDEQEPVQTEEAPQEPQKRLPHGIEVANRIRREKMREMIRQVMAHEDPVDYLMRTSGYDIYYARQKIRYWMKHFPEEFEGYEMPGIDKEQTKKEPPEAWMFKRLTDKHDELIREKDRRMDKIRKLEDEISALEDEIHELDDQRAALIKVMRMYDEGGET